MTLIGHQVLRGEAVTCPYHLIEHNFSNNDIMKQYSVSYLKHCLDITMPTNVTNVTMLCEMVDLMSHHDESSVNSQSESDDS